MNHEKPEQSDPDSIIHSQEELLKISNIAQLSLEIDYRYTRPEPTIRAANPSDSDFFKDRLTRLSNKRIGTHSSGLTELPSLETPHIPQQAPNSLSDEINNTRGLLENGHLSPREQAVITRITHLSGLLYQLLHETYSDQGWHVCGPAAVALSRMLSHDFFIPISQNGDGEHIEVCLGIFDPITRSVTPEFSSQEAMRLAQIEEQTYLKYFSPEGNVFYVDPIYPLLMDTGDPTQTTILVEQYPNATFDQELARKQNVFPFLTYPMTNCLHATQQVWKDIMNGSEGTIDEKIRNIINEYIQTLKVMNQIEFDGIPAVPVADGIFVTSNYFKILSALPTIAGYEKINEELLHRLTQQDSQAIHRKTGAIQEYLKARRRGRI